MKDIISNCSSKKYEMQFNLYIKYVSHNVSEIRGNITITMPFDDTFFVSNTFGPHIYDKINDISNFMCT